MDGTNNLLVPRHSYNASVSSNASVGKNRVSRLSRTNTSTTDGLSVIGADNQSTRTVDRIPSAKPSVSYSDKLWTQIDVLDDVKKMSEEVRSKGSFFNENFHRELMALKQSQNRLLETLATQQFDDIDKNIHRKQLTQLNTLTTDEEEEKRDDKTKEEKINEFFANDDLSKFSQDILYRKQNFAEMSQFVAEIKENLDKVGESMKRFDDVTKEMW